MAQYDSKAMSYDDAAFIEVVEDETLRDVSIVPVNLFETSETKQRTSFDKSAIKRERLILNSSGGAFLGALLSSFFGDLTISISLTLVGALVGFVASIILNRE